MSPTLPLLPLLVEPKTVEPYLSDPNVIVIQVTSGAVYAEGHIPGALHIPPSALMCGTPPAPGKTPDLEQLTQLCQYIGLTPNKQVIAVDDEGGGWAGRLLWTLDLLGHQHSSLLNGGLHAWVGDGYPLEQSANQAAQSDYKAAIKCPEVSITLEDLIIGLENQSIKVWDARSAGEYLGERQTAQKNGHMPGAVHYEWTRAMNLQGHLKIRDLDVIKAELAELGIHENSLVVTHCQSHHRSGFTYILGKLLGFKNIKAYPGSWSEWGNHPETPVESNITNSNQ